MSSSKYSAELATQQKLRVLVLLSGVGLGAMGLVLIFRLPLHFAVTAGMALAWSVLTLSELAAIYQGFRGRCGLRVCADGSLLQRDCEGCWRAAELLPGSVVLPRLAWIRLRVGRGARSAELLRARGQKRRDWRRLQVIWRHIGAIE